MQVQAYRDFDGHMRQTRLRHMKAMAAVFAVALLLIPAVHALPASVLAQYSADRLMLVLVFVWCMFGVGLATAMANNLPWEASTTDTMICIGVIQDTPELMDEFRVVFKAQGDRMFTFQLRQFEEKARSSSLAAALS